MRVAITGGTGFIGSHLARLLVASGHEVVLIARGPRRDDPIGGAVGFRRSDLTDPESLAGAFAGCEAVAHCAGINREIGRQTYQTVHVGGTRTVVDAARRAGVEKLVLLSFLARGRAAGRRITNPSGRPKRWSASPASTTPSSRRGWSMEEATTCWIISAVRCSPSRCSRRWA